MAVIQLWFEITHQHINRIDRFKPVSDTKNYLHAHFDFLTDEWNGMVTAIFTKNDISYKMLLDDEGDCLVPWELLQEEGELYVSCYCDNLITTNMSRVYIGKSGYKEEAENSQEPTPEMYQQFINKIDELKDDMLILDGGNFTDWKE